MKDLRAMNGFVYVASILLALLISDTASSRLNVDQWVVFIWILYVYYAGQTLYYSKRNGKSFGEALKSIAAITFVAIALALYEMH